MKQKSVPGKAPAEQVLNAKHAGIIRRKKRSASCWRGCGARRTSPSCVVARASRPRCITAGQGVPGGRQAPAGRRHGACCDLRRGKGSPPRGRGVEGSRGRPHPRESSAQKKHQRGWGGRGMRYPASEKAEIIQLVEQSQLPAKRTLDKLGIPRATFYRWYERYLEGGIEGLANHGSSPDRGDCQESCV